MRIVSLVPAATEMVGVLGLTDRLVGVTHECDYPEPVRHLPKVTRSSIPADISSAKIDAMVRDSVQSSRSLYALDREMLASLQPDLVITQSLCDVCAVDEVEVERALGGLDEETSIVRLEPTRLADMLDGIRMIGVAAGVEQQADEVIAVLSDRIRAVQQRSLGIGAPRRAAILEWIDPLFCAGHWNPELVQLAGGLDCLGQVGERSHRVAWEKLIEADPEVLLIACCGYTIERTHEDLPILRAKPGFENLACAQRGELYLMDGNSFFNRPGPRLVDSLEMLSEILHPETGSSPNPFKVAIPSRSSH
ncbi:MAG: cobalamin-binding protein [Planctomycetota bacterium]|jgi:iron complex transport system substrate-binding protein